ncbi:MAG: pyridoxamine 5'-phosphate oxidase [Cyclobacteriaceae bacterium]|jgi:pyridoxamine 5'-phosphate oxidase
MNVADLRRDYQQAELTESSVFTSPFKQFEKWFEEAVKADLLEPNAMALSTVNTEGEPSQRTVLLKAYDDKGLVFYTNYTSRKAQQIELNHNVSTLFPWYTLERQVIIQGVAEKVSTKESLSYFLSRPHGSQLGAWVSHQSKVISSRSILEMKLQEIKEKFQEGKVPLPDFWGGYRIKPTSFEFWQGRSSRLHDRILYQLDNNQWSVNRLAP